MNILNNQSFLSHSQLLQLLSIGHTADELNLKNENLIAPIFASLFFSVFIAGLSISKTIFPYNLPFALSSLGFFGFFCYQLYNNEKKINLHFLSISSLLSTERQFILEEISSYIHDGKTLTNFEEIITETDPKIFYKKTLSILQSNYDSNFLANEKEKYLNIALKNSKKITDANQSISQFIKTKL